MLADAILAVPMIQGLETSLRAGAVPQPPQIRPASAPVAAAAAAATQPSANDVEARSPAAEPEAPSANDVEARPAAADKPEAGETPGNGDDGGSTAVPPAVQPAAGAAHAQMSAAPAAVATEAAAAAPPDPLAEAKRRVQEEIKREFAAIMAAGTARAGEAAALATRRVMERHGQQRAAGAAQRV